MNPMGQLTWKDPKASLKSQGDLPFWTICPGTEMLGQWEVVLGMATD